MTLGNFRNDKVAAPLKHSIDLQVYAWNLDFRNDKVAAPLKRVLNTTPVGAVSSYFRNDKVAAPLKLLFEFDYVVILEFISTTIKLRPH